MTQSRSDDVFLNGESVLVGDHGEHEHVYVNGVPLSDSGGSKLVFEAGTGIDTGWRQIADLNDKRVAIDSGVAGDGTLYVTGGDDGTGGLGGRTSTESFDPETESWSRFTEHPNGHKGHAVWYDGTLYTGPGDYGGDGSANTYEETTGSWTKRSSAPTARDGVKGVLVDGIAYVIAGERNNSDNENRDVNEGYDVAADSWASYATIPEPVRLYGAAAVGTDVYVVGGYDKPADSNPSPVATVQVYDTVADSWSTATDYPDTVTEPAVASDGTDLYVSGGSVGGSVTNAVRKYDVSAGAWTTIEPMVRARRAHGMEYSDGALYAFGGRDPDGAVLASTETLDLSP